MNPQIISPQYFNHRELKYYQKRCQVFEYRFRSFMGHIVRHDNNYFARWCALFEKARRNYIFESLRKDEYGTYINQYNYTEMKAKAKKEGWKILAKEVTHA